MRAVRWLGLSLALPLALVGCKWTDFDDLEDNTWVRSTEDPDLGAADYGVAIGGVSQSSSGGVLAVISDDTANYSTLNYNSKGGAVVGPSPIKLGTQNIGALGDPAVFATDATGRIGLVARSINGTGYAVVFGSPTAPAGIDVMSVVTSVPAPDAGIFVGSDFVFVGGEAIYTVPSSGVMPIACRATDQAGMPLQAAGIGADATNLYVWTKGGVLLSYPLAGLSPCATGVAPVPSATTFTTTAFMPAAGASVIVSGQYAILAGHATTSRTGQVAVVDLATMTQVGTTLTVEGLKSAVLADVSSGVFLALGVPDRPIGGVVAGEVELHEYTPATGALDESPATRLHDARPESGQQFGRAVTTMQFNGNTILVVAGKGEVFAYYRMALYDHLP